MKRREKAPLLAVVPAVGALFLAGCGAESAPADGPQPPGQAATSAAAASPPIDACSLVPADKITELLGTPVEGVATDAEGSGCLWENPQNYESVSVEIGDPNTAVNGTLPPPEPGFPEVGTPGPDGMRFLGSGVVEFPAGGRSNTVQVAVLSMMGDAANDAGVELARIITPQLSG